jgi:proteasome lid subunit RPN8/RPN11
VNIIDAQICYADTSLDFLREVSCFITPEHGLLSLTTNDSGGSVDFGWDKIWDALRSSKVKSSCVIMIHSHPNGISTMSSIDFNMVQGWRLALGVPIYFNIVTQGFGWFVGWNGGWSLGRVSSCKVDRDENKKIVVNSEVFNEVEYLNRSYRILYEIIYGLSKCPIIIKDDILEIENYIKDSSMMEFGL